MKRIFLADDDEDDTRLLKEAICKLVGKANFVCAENGAELLQNLRDKIPPRPDFLFLDLNMPKITGYECLKVIKSDPHYKDLRVIILSTSRNQHDIDVTYREGADYYISKPSTLKGYEEALNKLFAHSFHPAGSKAEFVIH